MKEKTLLSWSGGRESTLALHELQQSGDHEIAALVTTLTDDDDRISMHGVGRVLLERQAQSLGYPIEGVFISKDTSHDEYASMMRELLGRYMKAGVSSVAFGDIFLEGVRRYRENNLSKVGMDAVFPLWGRDTTKIAQAFIDTGFKAVITCVDSNVLDRSFVGREFDDEFVSELPSDIDPCGENGEFHSFVYDGPMFKRKIPHVIGDVYSKDNRFVYCDLKPI